LLGWEKKPQWGVLNGISNWESKLKIEEKRPKVIPQGILITGKITLPKTLNFGQFQLPMGFE